jgi:hypothetical protein
MYAYDRRAFELIDRETVELFVPAARGHGAGFNADACNVSR